MRYRIEHSTRLELENPVWEHQCEIRLTPRRDDFQVVESAEIAVDPAGDISTYTDSFGNQVHSLSLLEPHQHFEARLTATVETKLENPFDFVAVPPREEKAWLTRKLTEVPALWDYVLSHAVALSLTKDFKEAELELPRHEGSRGLLASVQSAMAWVGDNFEYCAGVTQVHSTLADVLQARAGVCQDFAHLLILIVRSWGYPARYVMGYLDPSEDAGGAPHAWVEVFIPGAGWLGFDATHNLVANDCYVAVNVGRDYADAAPLRGSFKGDAQGTPPDVDLQMTRDQQ